MSHHKNSNGRIWLGAILIVIGALIFLKNFHFNILYIDIFSWPFILLVIGIIILVNRKDSIFGLILVIVGGIGIASKYLHISFRSILSEYWPILLILLGIYTIFKTFGKNEDTGVESIDSNEYYLDVFSIFGDITKIIKTTNFLGGKTTSLFSDLKVELRESKLPKGTIELDTVTLFGSTTIFIPNDWDVIIKTTTIFGGFEDHRGKSIPEAEFESKVLVVKGLVLFGSGEIKS